MPLQKNYETLHRNYECLRNSKKRGKPYFRVFFHLLAPETCHSPTMVKQLAELCALVVQSNAGKVLQGLPAQQLEQVIKLVAKHSGLSHSIVSIVDQKNWIQALDLKGSGLSDSGLSRICGMCPYYKYLLLLLNLCLSQKYHSCNP